MTATLQTTTAPTSGRQSGRPGTVLPRLGPRYSQVYADVCRLRKAVERTLGRKHTELSLVEGARLQSLCRLEMNCRIAEQGIRETPDMSPAELRSMRSCIATWTVQRDKMLGELLGNGNGPAAGAGNDPWAALDSPQDVPQDAPPSPETARRGDLGQRHGPRAVQGQDRASDATAAIPPPAAAVEISPAGKEDENSIRVDFLEL